MKVSTLWFLAALVLVCFVGISWVNTTYHLVPTLAGRGADLGRIIVGVTAFFFGWIGLLNRMIERNAEDHRRRHTNPHAGPTTL